MSEDTQASRELVASRRGATCVFREKIFIFPCTIASAATDSWGVRLHLQTVARGRFIYPPWSDELDISVAWGWGSIGEHKWSGGQGAGWVLYFDPNLMRSLEAVASEASGIDVFQQRRRLASCIDKFEREFF